MEDLQIIDLLFQRAEEALTAMAKRFGKRLYATAINLVSNPQDAEECVSDTYIAVWNAIPPLRPASLSAYVYRTGRNIALNRLRSNSAQKRSGYELSLNELEGCIPAPCPEDGRALGQTIDAFLNTLSRENRVIFLRRYWFGDGVKEIAQTLGYSESAVSVRLNRTRNKLRDYLQKEGYL